MKKMRVLSVSVLCLLTLMVAGCKKNTIKPIENDMNACKELSGSWNRVVRAESDVCTDPENPNTCVAEITYLTTTTITFGEALDYSLEVNQVLENFVPMVENCPYTKEQVAQNVNDYMKVSGTFTANSYLFQVINKTVTFSDGQIVSIEDLGDLKTVIGEGIQESTWAIEEDVLVMGPSSSNEKIEYRRVK